MKKAVFDAQDQAKRFSKFLKSHLSLQIIKNGRIVSQSNKRGILPLIKLLRKKKRFLKGSMVYDKVIGRAAALLFVYGQVDQVYAILGSREAHKALMEHKVHHQFKKIVPRILNQAMKGECPFEKLAAGRTPKQFYNMIKAKF